MMTDTCIDCGATPPQAESSYTAIGHGWRVQARTSAEGTVLEWRCGACWRNARANKPKGEEPRGSKIGAGGR